MEYSSQPTLAHNDTTLTGSIQYSSQIPIANRDQHTLLIDYNPDTNSTNALEVNVQVSFDELDTAAGSSTWIDYGTLSDSSGTLTFTAYTLSESSAGTSSQTLHWDFSIQAKKMRIGATETNSPGDFGNVTIWHFARQS